MAKRTLTKEQYDRLVKRAKIAICLELGMPTHRIQETCRCSAPLIAHVSCLAKSESPFALMHDVQSGRPKNAATMVVADQCKQMIEKDDIINLRDLSDEIFRKTGKKIATSTLRRTMRKSDIYAYKLRKRQIMPDSARQKRVDFATEHYGADFTHWIWVDEASVYIFSEYLSWVYATSLPDVSKYNVTASHGGGGHFSVWGAIGLWGKGPLVFINEHESANEKTKKNSLDSDKYISVLNTALPIIEARKGQLKQAIYAQDNAPCHKSKVVKKYLRATHMDIIDWPPYSPDLNPIENVWGILKKRISARNPRHLEELKQFITEEWDELSSDTVVACCANMNARLGSVLENGGMQTDY